MNREEFMQELEELFENEPDNYKFNAVLEMADAYAENKYETKKLEEKIRRKDSVGKRHMCRNR